MVMAAAAVDELQPVAARGIIEHLRRGSVPVEQVLYFTVGRERWLTLAESIEADVFSVDEAIATVNLAQDGTRSDARFEAL